ncbi:hypothetical protein [Paraburkholderia ribeironis]|uniref:hypothetical protein n=1 Tax=Paraburkholderia ribeironis TaxID=1247936 RepID=UPI000B9D539A|nr:hypothetical protein [Paraburkholderia ribeironis]
MREVPDPHVALLSRHDLCALGAAKAALDVWRHVVDIDDASFLINGKRDFQLAIEAKVPRLTMVAVSWELLAQGDVARSV